MESSSINICRELPCAVVSFWQQSDATDTTILTQTPVLPFSNLNEIFFGYFDPENIYLDNKNNYFSG